MEQFYKNDKTLHINFIIPLNFYIHYNSAGSFNEQNIINKKNIYVANNKVEFVKLLFTLKSAICCNGTTIADLDD